MESVKSVRMSGECLERVEKVVWKSVLQQGGRGPIYT